MTTTAVMMAVMMTATTSDHNFFFVNVQFLYRGIYMYIQKCTASSILNRRLDNIGASVLQCFLCEPGDVAGSKE